MRLDQDSGKVDPSSFDFVLLCSYDACVSSWGEEAAVDVVIADAVVGAHALNDVSAALFIPRPSYPCMRDAVSWRHEDDGKCEYPRLGVCSMQIKKMNMQDVVAGQYI